MLEPIQVNDNFAAYFKRFRCCGEVGLSDGRRLNDAGEPEGPDDFSQYKIHIKVQWRATEQLHVLGEGGRDSGGERSVATMVYLISLQNINPAPFRVVDEINQVARSPPSPPQRRQRPQRLQHPFRPRRTQPESVAVARRSRARPLTFRRPTPALALATRSQRTPHQTLIQSIPMMTSRLPTRRQWTLPTSATSSSASRTPATKAASSKSAPTPPAPRCRPRRAAPLLPPRSVASALTPPPWPTAPLRAPHPCAGTSCSLRSCSPISTTARTPSCSSSSTARGWSGRTPSRSANFADRATSQPRCLSAA